MSYQVNNVENEQVETISGSIERIIYHNEENGFCVLRIKVKKFTDLVTVVGNLTLVSIGEYIIANGIWFNDKTHGPQFKASYLQSSVPTSIEGIEKYLSSGLIRGVGPVHAKRLIAAFGEHVFEIIEQQPAKLAKIEGIGRRRQKMIITSWNEQKAVREIMLFLYEHKITTAVAVRIHKTYGDKAIKVITENPYQLARDVRSIGFVSADNIAANIGIERNSLIRAKAGLEHVLLLMVDKGHTGMQRQELLDKAAEILQIDHQILKESLDISVNEQTLIYDTIDTSGLFNNYEQKSKSEVIFLSGLYHLEKNIATLLQQLNYSGNLPWRAVEPVPTIKWVETKLNINLADSQKMAIELALSSKLLIITGGPGVGKTTIMSSILAILAEQEVKILLCAPTGRAAKRLSETTGLPARTIHRLLEINPISGEYGFSQDRTLSCDLLVIDEASMVDVVLMNAILRALPLKAALLLVGDVDQLPSIGPGQILRDMIDSQTIPVVRLTEVFRQDKYSAIITNAHKINHGIMPDLTGDKDDYHTDFYFIESKSPEDAMDKIKELVKYRIPNKFNFDPFKDIQILCPTNRGYLGANSINSELQKILNYNKELKVERFGRTYLIGDKVMQIKNDYEREVFNGDIGFVQYIDLDNSDIVISFDGKEVTYDFGELDQILPAYAITIHKSQGSEYPVVIVPIVMQSYMMLQKNLIYTAITRGKKLVIIVGEPQALEIALKKTGQIRRLTKLKHWLK